MPVLKFDEIPRRAGQYFGTISMHDNIIFNPNPPDAFGVYPGFNGNDVPWFQELRLSPRYPGIFVHFESEPVASAVHEQIIQVVARQNLPGCRVHSAATHPAFDRRDGRPLRFKNRPIPRSDAF